MGLNFGYVIVLLFGLGFSYAFGWIGKLVIVLLMGIACGIIVEVTDSEASVFFFVGLLVLYGISLGYKPKFTHTSTDSSEDANVFSPGKRGNDVVHLPNSHYNAGLERNWETRIDKEEARRDVGHFLGMIGEINHMAETKREVDYSVVYERPLFMGTTEQLEEIMDEESKQAVEGYKQGRLIARPTVLTPELARKIYGDPAKVMDELRGFLTTGNMTDLSSDTMNLIACITQDPGHAVESTYSVIATPETKRYVKVKAVPYDQGHDPSQGLKAKEVFYDFLLRFVPNDLEDNPSLQEKQRFVDNKLYDIFDPKTGEIRPEKGGFNGVKKTLNKSRRDAGLHTLNDAQVWLFLKVARGADVTMSGREAVALKTVLGLLDAGEKAETVIRITFGSAHNFERYVLSELGEGGVKEFLTDWRIADERRVSVHGRNTINYLNEFYSRPTEKVLTDIYG